MKYVAQFIFPALGKLDRQIVLDNIRDKIEIPLIQRPISIDRLDMDSAPLLKVMEFIFNGQVRLTGLFESPFLLCEYEFKGVKDKQSEEENNENTL